MFFWSAYKVGVTSENTKQIHLRSIQLGICVSTVFLRFIHFKNILQNSPALSIAKKKVPRKSLEVNFSKFWYTYRATSRNRCQLNIRKFDKSANKRAALAVRNRSDKSLFLLIREISRQKQSGVNQSTSQSSHAFTTFCSSALNPPFAQDTRKPFLNFPPLFFPEAVRSGFSPKTLVLTESTKSRRRRNSSDCFGPQAGGWKTEFWLVCALPTHGPALPISPASEQGRERNHSPPTARSHLTNTWTSVPTAAPISQPIKM